MRKSKQAAMLALLSRPSGAMITVIMAARLVQAIPHIVVSQVPIGEPE
jgi:hypothetical protein